MRCLTVAMLFIVIMGGTALANQPTDEELEHYYLLSVLDASHPDWSKMGRDLLAINTEQSELDWEGEPGASRVKAATLVSQWVYDNVYKDREGQEVSTYGAWFTLVPELKNYFTIRKGGYPEDIELGMRQALGLPHNKTYAYVVEVWVSPDQLARPSRDPETYDHESCMVYPETGGMIQFRDDFRVCTDSPDRCENSTWPQWMVDNADYAYDSDNPMPWTQGGYTYDWGAVVAAGGKMPLERVNGRPEGFPGLSEFVLRQPGTVKVIQSVGVEEYCVKKDGSSSSSGCVMNPSAGFNSAWMLIICIPLLAARRHFRKQ